jgi:hypothetical protein
LVIGFEIGVFYGPVFGAFKSHPLEEHGLLREVLDVNFEKDLISFV